MTDSHYNVIIIGGGAVGLGVALEIHATVSSLEAVAGGKGR
jgi:glycerol-3-phosphate dehydrogenase